MKVAHILFLLLLLIKQSNCQDSLINEIVKVEEVHFSAVGVGGVLSEQYKRYLTLRENFSVEELVCLLENKSPVIRLYAAWALADKKYSNLDAVFQKFLSQDKKVNIFMGCVKDKVNISHILYYRYWTSLKLEEKENDTILFKLDSIILIKSKTYLLSYSLNNRLFPRSFNPMIENLAFKRLNFEALFYLSNWYREQYKEKLRKAFVKVLVKTKFSRISSSIYYQIISELLKVGNSKTKCIIVSKLKKDRTWEREEKKFRKLLNSYAIKV